jgi:hypothetical protein
MTLKGFLLFSSLIFISFFEFTRKFGDIYHPVSSQVIVLGIKIPKEKIEESGKTNPEKVRKKQYSGWS